VKTQNYQQKMKILENGEAEDQCQVAEVHLVVAVPSVVLEEVVQEDYHHQEEGHHQEEDLYHHPAESPLVVEANQKVQVPQKEVEEDPFLLAIIDQVVEDMVDREAGEEDIMEVMAHTGVLGTMAGDGLDFTGGHGSDGDGYMIFMITPFLTSEKTEEDVMKFVRILFLAVVKLK